MNRSQSRTLKWKMPSAFIAAMAVEVALAPLVVVIGEPLRRRYLRAGRRQCADGGFAVRERPLVGRALVHNPVAIALTAPGRWVESHLPGRRARRFMRGYRPWDDGGPGGGVREPRRPKPAPPSDVIVLTEPRD